MFDQQEEEPVHGRVRGIKLAMNNSLWFVDQKSEFNFKRSYVQVSSSPGEKEIRSLSVNYNRTNLIDFGSPVENSELDY